MRIHFQFPRQAQLEYYLQDQARQVYSYPEVGASKGVFPANYHQHSNRFYLGTGSRCWQRAQEGIARWQPFNNGWATVYPADAAIEEDTPVVVSFRIFGIWWKNACRIVYVKQTDDDFGFAYGTLPGHVGRGEEYFGVTRDETGKCWFVLKAFSQPQYWGARLFPLLMRWQQRRFVRAAAVCMQTYCAE